MRSLGRQLRLLGDLLTDPRRGFATLALAPPLLGVLLVLGSLQAGLWIAQSLLVEPLVAGELGLRTTAAPASATGPLWIARALVTLLAPCAVGLRGAALAVLLQAGAALSGYGLPWRPLLSLVLHLEVVLWVETAATTLLLAIAQPASIEALHQLRLRAGLDLLFDPRSKPLAALLGAGNLFSIWWGLLLAGGLVLVLRLPRRQAAVLSGAAWAGMVGVRFLLDRR